MLYNLYLSKEPNIPQDSIIGEFKKVKDKEFKCYIILNDHRVYDQNMREAFVTAEVEDGRVNYAIYLTEAVLKKIQSGKTEHRFLVFHELGHIHSKHMITSFSGTDHSVARYRAIENGTVIKEEREADEFAVNHIGKNAAIRFIDNAIRERKEYNESLTNPQSPQNLAAVKELELRKKFIKNL